MIKNLKKLRNEKGISQQHLATKLGISQQSINKYENHSIEPDIETLIAIADYFDVTVDYLIGRTDKDGNNLNLSDIELVSQNYKKLNDNEKHCVDTIIKTFLMQK